MNLQERLQATYSMEWQGIRLRHAKPTGHSTERVRECIIGDGDPDYDKVFNWLHANVANNTLGVWSLRVMPETVAEFDRLFAAKNRGLQHEEVRAKCAQNLIGSTVHVYKLGGVQPEDDPNTEMFLPLPEYGIVLVTFKPKEHSAMVKMMPHGPLDNPWPDFGEALVRHATSQDPNFDAIHKAGNVCSS